MAEKHMEYTGGGLDLALPSTGEVVALKKGDVVDYDLFGGEAFFAGRTDFKPHKTSTTKTRKGKADG